MRTAVTLIDINPAMISAWQETFEENPEVSIKHGSMLAETVDAWVTPTNAKGNMDGGLDGIIKEHLGNAIQKRVHAAIKQDYAGKIPLGHATCVLGMKTIPRYLISTPTMMGSSEDISDSMNVALACCAAFQAIHIQNKKAPGAIRSVALPGLGANTGRVPPMICADLMWTAYDLFRFRQFSSFSEMRQALTEILGDLESPDAPVKMAAGAIAMKQGWGEPVPEEANDEDFDDDESINP